MESIGPEGYRLPRRNGIVRTKRRLNKGDRSKRLMKRSERFSLSDDECSFDTYSTGESLRGSGVFSSSTSLNSSCHSISQLSTREEIEEEFRLLEEKRKPAKHHEELMPLNELAKLMSSQLTLTKERGTFDMKVKSIESLERRLLLPSEARSRGRRATMKHLAADAA